MSQPNPKQREAIRYIDGPCLVLAGAGSGKTSVITRKIAYLIDDCQLPARHIAALTFTNKAAREMKERVGQLIPRQQTRGLTVSTFHNLGLSIIRRNHGLFGYKPGFSIFDGEDARALLKELTIKESDGDRDPLNAIQQQISRWKNELLSPAEALASAENSGDQQIALIYRAYNQALRTYNAVDFDDLIVRPVEVLGANPELLNQWRRKIRYLLVDEYQDTNRSQYRLLRLLVDDRGAFTVVGDDDQSIYAWRGAYPENLSVLQQDFPALKVIKLEQNYRSTQRILKAANHLIGHNPHQFTKTLWSDKAYGEPIRVLRVGNDELEAERVATEIVTQRLQRRAGFRDFAVLYRGNHQARLLELKLQHYQVPYAISGGTSFFARTEIKDIMAYLRLIVNPDDDNALLRIINTPRRQLGTGTVEALSQYANERGISLFTAMAELGLKARVTEAAHKRLQQFNTWITAITRRCESDAPVPTLREMLEDMDYLGWLHQNASAPQVAERRMENVNFLLDSIARMLNNSEQPEWGASIASEPLTLQEAIAKLVLQDLLEQQEEQDDGDRVQLLTLHAAKGLEFPHVLIVGLEEDLLPHRVSIDEDTVEEERRLAYVGITRAQRSLTLTLAANRKQFGEVVHTTPSRFIDELPGEDIDREGFGEEADPAVNTAKGNAALSNLLGMFD